MNSGVQHHYPASLIGQFGSPHSNPKKGRTRDRKVFLATRDYPDLVVSQRAATLGYDRVDHHLYDAHTNAVAWTSIDDIWEPLERNIPGIVRTVETYDPQAGIPTVVFLRGLLPLVAQLFVRHPRYELEVISRACAEQAKVLIDPRWGKAPLNMGRLVHYNVLCGLLLDCSWCIVTSPNGDLISSDLGFAPLSNPLMKRYGYTIPLSPEVAVCVCSGGRRFKLKAPETYLRHGTFTVEQARGVNGAVAWHAPKTIFGRTRGVVADAAGTWTTQLQDDGLPPPPALLFYERPNDRALAEHWLRMMHSLETRIGTRPSDDDFLACSNCTSMLALIDNNTDGTISSQPAGN